MTYAETLDYLYHRLPMYQRSGPVAMKKDLTNIRLLLDELGNPERALRCIHVGGTNGKGTVSHLLAAALQAHDLKVGLYTSPHYKDFRERIKIDGALIAEEEVLQFVERMRPWIERIEPSFFEITVALAFHFFAGSRVDWCVIEVGLGGRLDSTNVIDPVLSVITNIGLDHTQFLGTTLEAIAGEKAGIIKPGRPVVIGESHPETEAVFRGVARRQEAPITFADQERRWRRYYAGADLRPQLEADRMPKWLPHSIVTELEGPFLEENFGTAVAALERLVEDNYLSISTNRLLAAWTNPANLTNFIGRWQTLQEAPLVIADSAHNAEGIGPVIDRLVHLTRQRKGRLHMVLGVVKDKDLDRVLPLFPRLGIYYFVKADVPRGLDAEELRLVAEEYRLYGDSYAAVAEGYGRALREADTRDVVFVGGSIFTVGEVL